MIKIAFIDSIGHVCEGRWYILRYGDKGRQDEYLHHDGEWHANTGKDNPARDGTYDSARSAFDFLLKTMSNVQEIFVKVP